MGGYEEGIILNAITLIIFRVMQAKLLEKERRWTMKNIRKMLLPVFAIFAILLGVTSVFATRYETYANISSGGTVRGSLRQYTSGEPMINYEVHSIGNNRSSKFNWKVIDEDNYVWSNLNTSVSSSDYGMLNIQIGERNVASGKYRFDFTTKINGVNYSSVSLNPLYLVIS